MQHYCSCGNLTLSFLNLTKDSDNYFEGYTRANERSTVGRWKLSVFSLEAGMQINAKSETILFFESLGGVFGFIWGGIFVSSSSSSSSSSRSSAQVES